MSEGTTGAVAAPAAGEQINAGANPAQAQEQPKVQPQSQPQTQAEPTKETDAERRARFDAMIGEGGEFADLFREARQKAVNGGIARGKAALEKTLKAQQPVLDLLMARYGTQDMGQLQAAINKDASWWQAYADGHGISEEQARNQIAMQAELDGMKRQKALEAGDRQIEAWGRQAQEVQDIYPEFDLQAACENPDFMGMLRNGISMRVAYEVLNMADIKRAVAERATKDAEARLSASIRANGSRPVEGGTSGQPGATVKKDPAKMSKAEFNETLARVARGEKVSFG